MGVDPGNLDKILTKIKSTYGPGAHRMADSFPPVLRIPTGSYTLDYATYGGIPVGRWSRFYGGYSSGKTMIAYNVIKNAQQITKLMAGDERYLDRFPNDMLCAYYNVEGQFYKERAEEVGIDTSKLHIFDGTIIEEIGDKLEASFSGIHVHVIDSTTKAVAQFRSANPIDQEHRGLEARRWGETFDHVFEHFDKAENTVIFTSHVRVKQGGFNPSGGESLHAPGGKNMEHSSDLTLQFQKSKWLYRLDDDTLTDDQNKVSTKNLSGSKEADGVQFKVFVEKSRVSPPFKWAIMRVDFANAKIDTDWELTEAVKHKPFGLFETVSNNGWYSIDGKKYHGEAGLREAINSDPELKQRAIEAIKGQ